MADVLTYDKRIFADNLLRLMKAQHEKQVDIARLLGVSKSTVSGYCAGTQMPRMDKIETLAHHFGVSRAELIGDESPAPEPAPLPVEPEPTSPAVLVYEELNERGQAEFLRYGNYLRQQPEYRAEKPVLRFETIKHFLVPAAAGYASPIQGEDYEEIPRTADTPAGADFCITVRGDSMEPFIPAWTGTCSASSGARTTGARCTCCPPTPCGRTPTSTSPGTAAGSASASARCCSPAACPSRNTTEMKK